MVVRLETAWQRASLLAGHTDGAFVLTGSGDSMRPLYEPGTILVVQQVPFSSLKRGQTVLYRSQQQKIVAHVLVTRAHDGWRAQGLNNPRHDMEPIWKANFVGIVIAAYQPTGLPALARLAGLR